jgi:hypothetical protein
MKARPRGKVATSEVLRDEYVSTDALVREIRHRLEFELPSELRQAQEFGEASEADRLRTEGKELEVKLLDLEVRLERIHRDTLEAEQRESFGACQKAERDAPRLLDKWDEEERRHAKVRAELLGELEPIADALSRAYELAQPTRRGKLLVDSALLATLRPPAELGWLARLEAAVGRQLNLRLPTPEDPDRPMVVHVGGRIEFRGKWTRAALRDLIASGFHLPAGAGTWPTPVDGDYPGQVS